MHWTQLNCPNKTAPGSPPSGAAADQGRDGGGPGLGPGQGRDGGGPGPGPGPVSPGQGGQAEQAGGAAGQHHSTPWPTDSQACGNTVNSVHHLVREGFNKKKTSFYPHFVDKRFTPPPYPRWRIL